MERWKDWSVLKTNPQDESRKAAYVVTAVVLCVCVCVSSLVFSRSGKKSSDSENRCLSVVSVIRLSKRKRAEHACMVLVV